MQKLSKWAEEQGIEYKEAWNQFNSGVLPVKAKKSKTGRIWVESTASETKTTKEKPQFVTPLFADFGEHKEAKASAVRRNKAATNERTDEFYHIERGVEPFVLGDRNGKSGATDCVSVSEAIRLTQKAYYNFSDFRNVTDVMTEFSTSDIYLRGGTKKSREFFYALFKKINLLGLQDKFFREYYRSGNVFPYRFESIIKNEDISNLNKIYGANAAKGIKLPSKYIILNPANVIVGGNISFSEAVFYQRLNSYEVQRLVKPVTQEDRDFLNSLPDEVKDIFVKKKASGSQIVDIPLSPEFAYFIFYKKQDYEPMAVPMGWPVLKDINWKAEMKAIDMAVARTTQRAILVVTMGYQTKDGEYMFDAKAAEAMRALFESESVGKVLVADFTTKAEWVIPEVDKLLGQEKYKQVNEDIKTGLNNILVGSDEKFANQSIKVKLFIQRLQQSREVFLNEFLEKEIRRISDEMGFKGKCPVPYFEDLDWRDADLWQRIVAQMAQMGLLTAEETFRAMEDGVLPTSEESEESQRKFKELKDEGLYEPVTGGPQTQKELTDKTNKQQLKMQEKQHEFDDKQDTKQKKHEINNPKPEPPQIHINAPGLKKTPGKPVGTKSTSPVKKKTKPISASLMRENLILATKLNENLHEELCKKFKLKELNEDQDKLAGTLLENIMCGEEPSNWIESISKYLKNPDYVNQEQFEKVRKFSEEMNLDDYSAAIAYNSQKDKDENEKNG